MNPRLLTPLQWALGISLVVHASLLTVRFVDPARFDRMFQDTPLEVVLVNAQSSKRPDKALAIAQHNLDGGGDAERARATTPLPYTALNQSGDASDDAQRRLSQMQEQQTLLLSQLKQELARLPPPDPAARDESAQTRAQDERRRLMLKMLAEIERRMQQENERPRKRYFSASTQAATYAAYYDAMRQRIETKGTENFPTAQGFKLYGELTMIVTVNYDGRVLMICVIFWIV